MEYSYHMPIPAQRALRKLGRDMKDARKRRRMPMELMAERAGFSRSTLVQIEKGADTVSMGNYASALFVLGMLDRLSDIADHRHDDIGLRLEEQELPKRIRYRKTSI